MSFLRPVTITSALILLLGSTALAQSARVTLELVTEPGFPLTGSRPWMSALEGVGADGLQIRSGRGGDETGIKDRGTETSPSYHVVGILSADNKLKLPGRSFSMSDKAAIAAWIAKLKADGTEGLFSPTGAFGLTAKQLVGVYDKLSVKVANSTKGRRAGDVAREITQALPVTVIVDASARPAFAGQETVAEELSGMTSGTALAAVLRPLGLVATLDRPSGGEVRLIITDVRRADEVWPVGWPPEKSPRETMPELFNFLNIEIEDFAISEALGAVQDRLKIPFLYDQNAMARHGVELTTQKATLPSGRSYYKKIIDRLLAASKPQMKSELRVDESGQPLLWITTVKP